VSDAQEGFTEGWWRGFFDDAYRFLYGELLGPARTGREVAALSTLLGLREGTRVLDLCCGDGRHCVPLARRGCRVTGLDASAVLLQSARERCWAATPSPAGPWAERVLPGNHPGPALVLGDARALPLRGASFDAAICLFNSIGYAGDEGTRALFNEAARVLRPGGRLLVECDPLERALASSGGEGVRTREAAQVRGVPVEIERWIEAGWQRAVFRWEEEGVRRERSLQHRLHPSGLLRGWLEAAGLARVLLFGGWDGRPFEAGCANLLLLAQKGP
jgi:SAM-dependent methyltransferase